MLEHRNFLVLLGKAPVHILYRAGCICLHCRTWLHQLQFAGAEPRSSAASAVAPLSNLAADPIMDLMISPKVLRVVACADQSTKSRSDELVDKQAIQVMLTLLREMCH